MGVFGLFVIAIGLSVITERRDTGLYKVLLSVSLLGFRIGTMLVCEVVYFLLRAVLNA